MSKGLVVGDLKKLTFLRGSPPEETHFSPRIGDYVENKN